MKNLILLIFVYSISSIAGFEEWNILGKKTKLFNNKKLHKFFSGNCKSEKHCTALQVLKIIKIEELKESEVTFGKNPGSALCRSLDGQVVLGLDSKKNQNTFCLFKDKSLISSGSLLYHARENSKKK